MKEIKQICTGIIYRIIEPTLVVNGMHFAVTKKNKDGNFELVGNCRAVLFTADHVTLIDGDWQEDGKAEREFDIMSISFEH